MPKNTAIPYFQAGPVTGIPTVAVVGKRFVGYVPGGKGNAPKVAPATAKLAVAGVAGHDAAIGEAVAIETDGVIPVVAGEALAQGDKIAAGADGVAMKAVAGDITVGTCTAETAIAKDAPIRLSV